jgi:hypothetical protein
MVCALIFLSVCVGIILSVGVLFKASRQDARGVHHAAAFSSGGGGMLMLAAQREPRQRHQTGFFTAGAAPPPSALHAAARRAQTEALSDEYSAAPELRQQNAAAEGAAAAAACKANGSNQAIIPINPSGALRLTSPKPRVRPRGGLEALEEQWRAAAEPEELVSLAKRVEATVVPHHLYTGSRGIMSVLRQWGRCASSPAAPIGRHASPTTGGLAPTARLAPKRPRPAALRPWSPVSARSASADPFAFMPSELPDDERAQGRCRGSGRKRRSMRPARGHVDYRGQLYDLESD